MFKMPLSHTQTHCLVRLREADRNKLPPQHHHSTSHLVAQIISPWLPELILFPGISLKLIATLKRNHQSSSEHECHTASFFFSNPFLQKDKGPSEITGAPTWVCKFAGLTFKILTRIKLLCAFWDTLGVTCNPEETVLIARKPLGCCLRCEAHWGRLYVVSYAISGLFWILLVLL